MSAIEKEIFRKGSTTYYFSSRFFPREIRGDVFKLYSFVRVVDDYVDSIPPQADRFYALRAAWDSAKDTEYRIPNTEYDSINERVIKNILHLTRKYDFDIAWIGSFLDAMESDLQDRAFRSLEDTLNYIYGSSEVVGLMMAKIMDLPEEATRFARMQGRAMQWLNFVRDVSEDNALGRCYFPQTDLDQFGLKSLSPPHTHQIKNASAQFIRYELERYEQWQAEASKGFAYIPRRLRIPLQTAVDMHNWTAIKIAQDPLVVFDHKIKPGKFRVITRGLYNGLIPWCLQPRWC